MQDQDKQGQHQSPLSRRQFLASVASTAPAVAAVTMAPQAASAAPAAPQADTVAKGYRLTSHILAYYKSAAL